MKASERSITAHRAARAAGLVACLSAIGCGGGGDASVDAAMIADAGPRPDSGAPVIDAGSAGDAGSVLDASVAPDASDAAVDVPITIRFRAQVGSQSFACGQTYTGQGMGAATTVEPRDARFFVQTVRLIRSDGTEVPVRLDVRSPWQTAEVALLDFEDGSGACAVSGSTATNTEITGTVPPGSYTGLIFTNGVPHATNHAPPTVTPPLQAGPLYWAWGFGFLFAKAEVTAPAGGEPGATTIFHLGSGGCTGETPSTVICSNPNRNLVRLTDFVAADDVVIVDIGALFATTDLTVGDPCHSGSDDTACAGGMTQLGIEQSTGAPLATQSVYRVTAQ